MREGLAHLALVFKGPEEGTDPSEHILVVSDNGLQRSVKPKVREEGEMELGFSSQPAPVTYLSI